MRDEVHATVLNGGAALSAHLFVDPAAQVADEPAGEDLPAKLSNLEAL